MVPKPWLFFYPFPSHMSTIPNLHHSFSVHLMNCYFPGFWYSHVTEKRTSEGRNAICEKSRISCGSKVHSFWNALKNTGPKILIKTETPRITEQVSNIEGVVILMHSKGQILRSTPNPAPLTCGACYSTQPEGLLTMA